MITHTESNNVPAPAHFCLEIEMAKKSKIADKDRGLSVLLSTATSDLAAELAKRKEITDWLTIVSTDKLLVELKRRFPLMWFVGRPASDEYEYRTATNGSDRAAKGLAFESLVSECKPLIAIPDEPETKSEDEDEETNNNP